MCKLFIFCGTSAADQQIAALFLAHAQYYIAQGHISLQSDQTILPGSNTANAIANCIAQADAIVWILSVNVPNNVLSIVAQTTQQRKFAIYASHVTTMLITELLLAGNVIMPTPTQPLLPLTDSKKHQEMSLIVERIAPMTEAATKKHPQMLITPPKLI